MRPLRTRSLASVACVAAVVSTPLAPAQDNRQDAESAPPVVAINSAGLEGWLSSDKDRALRDLLRLVGPRLSELPAELSRLGMDEADEIPADFLDSAWEVLSRPQSFELRLNLNRLREQSVPVDVRWAATATDLTSASNAVGVFRNALRDAPIDFQMADEPGVFIADTPAIPVFFGAKRANGSPVMFLSTEDGKMPDMTARYAELPEGATQTFGLRFDLGQLTPVIGMPIGMAPPVVGELLMEAGLVGWDATRFDMAIGHDDSLSHATVRMTGAARSARLFAIDPERSLSVADFAIVPEDATVASLGLYDASKTLGVARRVMESLDVWDDFERGMREEAEIDPATIEAFVRSIGDVWVYYQSDSTGGGEFSSAIMSVTLRDRATFEQALATAVGKANALGAQEGNGYVRVRSSESAGMTMYSLTSPGLPLPAEPTLAIHGDRVYLAMSIPSLMAAIRQASADRSIVDREGLLDFVGGSLDGIAGFSFMDTERYARRGYGTMNHVVAALVNGVRSPSSDREPYERGIMMPSYNELMEGVVPTVSVTRWDGEDLVVTATADRSVTVQLAAGFGRANLGAAAGQFLPMMIAGGASSAPIAVVEARSTAKQAASSSQVRQVLVAAVMYAEENDGRFPSSVQDLVESEFLDSAAVQSPFGAMMDGRPDIVLRSDLREMPEFASDVIVAIDRSALEFIGETAVGFADGHVEWHDHWSLMELLETPENEGAMESFDLF